MRFEPKSEKEISEANLMPAGIYNCEISAAEEQSSKAGNDMIKLTLTVWDQEGNERKVFDYLLEAIPGKLRHCAEMCGLLDVYSRGELRADDLVGKAGQAKLGIKKDKTGTYPDQNAVQDYLINPPGKTASTLAHARQPAMAGGGNLDDDIPFGPEWR